MPEVPLRILKDGLDPVQLGHAADLKVATILHDLIPLRNQNQYGPDAVGVYHRYAKMLAAADLVLATTAVEAGLFGQQVSDFGFQVPRLETIALPAQFAGERRRRAYGPARGSEDPFRILVVATWEPRKNLLLLLEAFQEVQRNCIGRFELIIVGRAGGFPAHNQILSAAINRTPNVTSLTAVTDQQLAVLYHRSHVTVYPSIEEGFGLPVLESLWLGTPSVCHAASAMAEIAPGGGTLTIDMTSMQEIVATIRTLAAQPDILVRLCTEINARDLRCWADYASSITALL